MPARVVGAGLGGLPVEARGLVSGVLGGADRSFWVRADRAGLYAVNAPQGLTVRFTRAAVAVRVGSSRLALALVAVGYGERLRAPGPVIPRRAGDRVVYARGVVREWYVNGPLGLEQGFTIARRLAGGGGPLTLSLAVGGDLRPVLLPGGRALALDARGGRLVLRYAGLRVTDAGGRALPAWLSLSAGRFAIRVDARGARYPLRADPFIQQGKKLTGRGESGGGAFGWSVALSSDGNTALVGGPDDNPYSTVGAAWVFTQSHGVWSQQGRKLTARGESQGNFGTSVALSADGNTALVGGPDGNGGLGAVLVFTRSHEVWSQQGKKLTGRGESKAGGFGSSVALSADGNTVLIDGDEGPGGVGAVWVFTRSRGVWSQQGKKLTGRGDSKAGTFGSSLALSADGNTALVCCESRGFDAVAWVFARSHGVWFQQRKPLIGRGETSPCGGGSASVALSADGRTALVGVPVQNCVGAAWVFTRSRGVWSQQGKKLTGRGEKLTSTGTDPPFIDDFGESVALSGNGNIALVGAEVDNGYIGAAWVFTRSGSRWSQQGKKLSGRDESGSASFGNSVALSGSGNTALVGGWNDNLTIGAAWVFVAPTAIPTLSVSPRASAAAVSERARSR